MEIVALEALPDLYESIVPRPSRDIQERIDALWERERAKGRTLLFDGQILSLLERRGAQWVCAFVPYRYWVAQRRSEPLSGALRIRPLAVGALLRCAEGVILGRRAAEMHQAPGYWELAPSGGIDPRARVGARRVSAQAQLFLELDEEVGVRGGDVRVLRPFARIDSAARGTCELVFEVQVPLPFSRLRAAWAAAGRGEYSELRCCPLEALEATCAELGADLLTGAKRLLAARGWLAGPGFSPGDPSEAASLVGSPGSRGASTQREGAAAPGHHRA